MKIECVDTVTELNNTRKKKIAENFHIKMLLKFKISGSSLHYYEVEKTNCQVKHTEKSVEQKTGRSEGNMKSQVLFLRILVTFMNL